MLQSKWASIIYTRTYEIDFDVIVIPEGFTNEDKQWAKKHILGTTLFPENILKQQRWSVFKNEHYCVVGVTCMLREIIEKSDDNQSLEITNDFANRLVYAFLGYVAKLTQDSFVEIPSMNIELFKELYKYVAKRWNVKSFDPASRIPDISNYEIEFEPKDLARDGNSHTSINLNVDEKQINLWPNSDDKTLWSEVAKYPNPISLCLGMPREKDAIDSCFLNATLLHISEPYTRYKKKQLPITIEPALDTTTSTKQVDYPGSTEKKTHYANREENICGEVDSSLLSSSPKIAKKTSVPIPILQLQLLLMIKTQIENFIKSLIDHQLANEEELTNKTSAELNDDYIQHKINNADANFGFVKKQPEELKKQDNQQSKQESQKQERDWF